MPVIPKPPNEPPLFAGKAKIVFGFKPPVPFKTDSKEENREKAPGTRIEFNG